jgi:hypothetical protein
MGLAGIGYGVHADGATQNSVIAAFQHKKLSRFTLLRNFRRFKAHQEIFGPGEAQDLLV